ncbi:MAG: hypothetical protein HQL63_09740 [Magnetococcales bacterium]|nr:hypothetical protein [Magnetococcales bacterium]MBF0322517.1 hypothetical protein [Magnetococcales bacterium]
MNAIDKSKNQINRLHDLFQPRLHEAGVSYVELIILILTIGIIMSGFAGAIGQALENPSQTVRIQQASELMQAGLESISSIRQHNGFAAIPNSSSTNLTDSFVRTITVVDDESAACPSAVAGTCKRVTVAISRNSKTLAQGELLLVNYDP